MAKGKRPVVKATIKAIALLERKKESYSYTPVPGDAQAIGNGINPLVKSIRGPPLARPGSGRATSSA